LLARFKGVDRASFTFNKGANVTIDQLMGLLDDLRDELGGDTPVQLMTQPHYPMKNEIMGVVSSKRIDGYREEDDDDDEEDDEPISKKTTVFILSGDNNGYGTKTAWTVADL
jgi:hypothetical protein